MHRIGDTDWSGKITGAKNPRVLAQLGSLQMGQRTESRPASVRLRAGAAEASTDLLHAVALLALDRLCQLVEEFFFERNAVVIEGLGESLARGLSLVEATVLARLLKRRFAGDQIVRCRRRQRCGVVESCAQVGGRRLDRGQKKYQRGQQIPGARVEARVEHFSSVDVRFPNEICP